LKLLYDIFIGLYPLAARLISGKNTKARLWVEGRKGIFTRLSESFKGNHQPVIWMHCSSLGEFEQGRPVIEEIRSKNNEARILLTFFSPSGYEVRKNYEGADWVFYLPMDSKKNAQLFFDIVKPSLVLFVKYEFWFYYLDEAKRRNIPLLLVSGIFRKNQLFFKWYGGFYRKMLDSFTHLFVQNQDCVQLLSSIGINNSVSISGDTRFDRVIQIANQFQSIKRIEDFVGNSKVIVAGSTWTADDEELDHYANTHEGIKFIIAPHEIENERITECLRLYKNSILFSEWKSSSINSKEKIPNSISRFQTQESEIRNQKSEIPNVLIIDNIGMLSKLYHYATICYVGGGFGSDGVHNVLEAAVYNKPVVFGPEYEKYAEVIELVDAEGGISIDNALELEKELDALLNDPTYYSNTSAKAGNYVSSKSGATEKIVGFIQEKRLLTN
jgi:3-deoxy-D-manno-octulosonic-acid transferase